MHPDSAASAATDLSSRDTNEDNHVTETGTFALEARILSSADALLRVLNPLQKLDLEPLTLRAGKAWGTDVMLIEVQFRSDETRARQFLNQILGQAMVETAELMRCSR